MSPGTEGLLAYRVARRLFRLIARPLFAFEVEGSERVPQSGPAVLVARHHSWLDPACLGGACPRPVRFLILEHIYEKPAFRWFYRQMRSIPVAPGGFASVSALRKALRLLDQGQLVGVFPEGRVIVPGRSATIHPGAALLAVRGGAPVIPVVICGSADAWPHGRALPGPARVSVRIGAPIPPPEGRGREAVAAMLGEIERALVDP